MSKIRCIIVEDEPLAVKVLSDYIQEVPFLELQGHFKDAILATDWLRRATTDLIFLDIHLPKLKGMAFLKTLAVPPAVIITTAYHQYAVEGFELNVTDYLLKPIEFERFLMAVRKVEAGHAEVGHAPKSGGRDRSDRERRWRPGGKAGARQDASPGNAGEVRSPGAGSEQGAMGTASGPGGAMGPRGSAASGAERDFFFISVQKKKVRILFQDILFVESQREYVKIVTEKGEYLTKLSTHEIESLLPEALFRRVHRSFIVSLRRIESYSAEMVEVGGVSIPIGKGYRDSMDDL
jgi:DNA-binding LytR/AlgR family response regulator